MDHVFPHILIINFRKETKTTARFDDFPEFVFSKKTFDELNVDRVSVNTTGLRLPARVASVYSERIRESGPPRRCREEELGHSIEAYGILRLFERATTLVENPFNIFDMLVGVRN